MTYSNKKNSNRGSGNRSQNRGSGGKSGTQPTFIGFGKVPTEDLPQNEAGNLAKEKAQGKDLAGIVAMKHWEDSSVIHFDIDVAALPKADDYGKVSVKVFKEDLQSVFG